MGVPVVADKKGNFYFGGKKYRSGAAACKAGAGKEWVAAAAKRAGIDAKGGSKGGGKRGGKRRGRG